MSSEEAELEDAPDKHQHDVLNSTEHDARFAIMLLLAALRKVLPQQRDPRGRLGLRDIQS